MIKKKICRVQLSCSCEVLYINFNKYNFESILSKSYIVFKFSEKLIKNISNKKSKIYNIFAIKTRVYVAYA